MSRSTLPSRDLRSYGDELRASLAAGQELGPGMSDAVAARFLSEIDRAIEAKIEVQMARHERSHRSGRLVLAAATVGSTTAMIPLTAVAIHAGGFEGFLGAFVAWLVIVSLDLIVALKS